jgi:flagellar protein FliS
MFGKNLNPAQTYAATSLESDVRSASPHRLIALLFEGVESAISMAKLYAQQNNAAERSANISKAVDILANGLRASLNMEAGGGLSERLAALYDYMISRLLWSNMKNDVPTMDEVLGLLGEIHGAWNDINPNVQGGGR